jgi:hypothetical protein
MQPKKERSIELSLIELIERQEPMVMGMGKICLTLKEAH